MNPLLRAILEFPQDRARRLIYADWLQENGDEVRADFIRRSIAAGPDGENGWTLQPHIHHPDKDLFRLVGMTDDQYLYRNGLVDECRLTTAAFLGGGECGRCRGRGWVEVLRDGEPVLVRRGAMGTEVGWSCPACGGTGAAAGLAAVLGQAGPLRAITLTDREPHHIDDDDRWQGLWMWQGHTADGRRYPFRVDWGLFRRMKADEHHVYHGIVHPGECENIYYPTRDLAVSSLSTACLALLRR